MKLGFSVSIPVVNVKGEQEGSLFKFLPKRPEIVPRIGETVWVAPELALKVEDVTYDGPNLFHVSITLEPVSTQYVNELTDSRVKTAQPWSFSEASNGRRRSPRPEDGLS